MEIQEDRARSARVDRGARERVVILNQTLLGGVVVLATLLVLWIGDIERPALFVSGATAAFLATGAALIVPWNRLPHLASAILPAVDIVAILLLRESSEGSDLGILWVFPVMWIAWSYGLAGAMLSAAAVSVLFWGIVAIDPGEEFGFSVILLPVTVTGVAVISLLAARRGDAQRALLEKQSRHLQKSVERARRQEDIVTDVLDAVDFGLLRMSADGTIAVSNEAHHRLQRAGGGDAAAAAYAADGRTPLSENDLPLPRARRGETFENELIWYGDPGEERRAVNNTARRMRDLDGSDAGTIVISRDVTNEELAIRAREDLISSVSHELRTPLTSIMGYLDLALDDDELSPMSRRSLEVAERNAGRLLELVADILAMSAAARSGLAMKIDPERTDLAEVIHAAIESAAPRAAERRITIDGSSVETTIAYADAHRIRQVVDNLISNAVKYNHDGGHVDVAVTSDGLHAWITVHDDGPGISENELPQLFERFFRSDAVRQSTTHGSGLGLAISRDIVRAHGGEVTVQTRVDEGTTFVVRLPASEGEEA
ncbi:HAMP domain-containing histidine kinase [Microbacterium sp. LRZ72]|uniref:sensor histidine kinase n=1 Tax=Microbacterium sp. LRZ72 TaxID=2942481 RepID=UPI0029AA4407|nr:HAMP domain-containing sensor histidine kinase [Microbacterium sp. LRZ72]MDX2375246.1 HAMP domain-containing histidine kinase [Microbacterium sp. LRZ72]